MKKVNGIHTEQIQSKRDGKDSNDHDTKFFTIKKNDTKLN